MPYYNITLTDHPVQSKNAGTTPFASDNYWSKEQGWNSEAVNNAVDIDMNNAANAIQKYITAYKTTLKVLGIDGITVRAAKVGELAKGMIMGYNNPGKSGSYWVASARANYALGIYTVGDGGAYRQ